MSDRDYEAEAKVDGWVPLDQWKGDPEKWIAAEDFVKRGETILPIVQAKYRKTVEEVGELKRRLDERESVFNDFRTFQEQALTKAQRERAEAIEQLEAERKKAITEGDGETFTRADKKLQELRAEPPPKKENGVSPETQAWLNENTWYMTDPVMKSMADGLSDLVAKENPGLKGRAFLDRLTERVKAELPHKFENPRRQEQITGEGQRKGGKKGKSFEDLPADAQVACNRFVKTIPGYTVEKYLATYSWE